MPLPETDPSIQTVPEQRRSPIPPCALFRSAPPCAVRGCVAVGCTRERLPSAGGRQPREVAEDAL